MGVGVRAHTRNKLPRDRTGRGGGLRRGNVEKKAVRKRLRVRTRPGGGRAVWSCACAFMHATH